MKKIAPLFLFSRPAQGAAPGPVSPGAAQIEDFKRLILPHLDGAYNLACYLTRDPVLSQDVVQEVVVNTLAGLKAELKRDPDNPPLVFTFETPSFRDASAIPRVRLAVLDQFDGATWSSTARYGKVGTVLIRP